MNRKIYCCFQFFNELELLKLKLEELYSIVDYFVVSESNTTHSGNPKLFYFDENSDQFQKFSSKIIHQKIFDTPNDYLNLQKDSRKSREYNIVVDKINAQTHWNKSQSSYGRDSFEKEMLYVPLMGCQNNDIIILGDCDEIPKAKTLKNIIKNFDENKIYHLQHNMFYYYLNLRKNEPWYGNIVLSYKKFKENSFCEMRQNKKGIFIEDGGWHFSYQGSIDTIKHKIESFGEQSLNLNWVKNGLENNINNAIELGKDLYNRPCKFWIESISYATHPKYLVDNQDEFSNLIYKEDK